jgi:hypothetical protein
MPPNNHSILGASSAHRWMNCPPSARLTEEIEDETSEYAKEGSAAHELCEWKVKKALKMRAGKRPASDYWSDEMEECSGSYKDYIVEIVTEARKTCQDALILIEQHLDFSKYVPDGFGTGDFILVTDTEVHVVDYKHGKGVKVEADFNPQMMLYALGAYEAFSSLYDIENVKMTIFQPRLNNVSTFEMKVSDLLNWAEQDVKPRAELAFKGEGEYVAGEHCKFCKARNTCRKRAEEHLKLVQLEFKPGPLLTDKEIGAVLSKASDLSKWASDIVSYAQAEAIDNGKHFDGYKLVEGRSVRKFTSEKEVVKAANSAGYTDIYDKKLITLTAFEKLMGKADFNEILGEFVDKPKGKLTLVPVSDKRPEVTVNKVEQEFND